LQRLGPRQAADGAQKPQPGTDTGPETVTVHSSWRGEPPGLGGAEWGGEPTDKKFNKLLQSKPYIDSICLVSVARQSLVKFNEMQWRLGGAGTCEHLT
jgi:hypothetical protein